MDSYKQELDPKRINIGYTARDSRINESHYTRVLVEAGANPIRFQEDVSDFDEFVASVDGMLFTGGDDIDPALYGEAVSPQEGKFDAEWDKREIKLMQSAHKLGLPSLANCRGLQVMNVALGGTLYQDLIADKMTTFNHMVYPRIVNQTVHEDYIVKDSHLGSILADLGKPHDKTTFAMPVNSSHHQGVDKAAEPLTIVAHAFDGVIEGLEDQKLPFFIGVQWHPEDLDSNHILHDELLAHARKYKESRQA